MKLNDAFEGEEGNGDVRRSDPPGDDVIDDAGSIAQTPADSKGELKSGEAKLFPPDGKLICEGIVEMSSSVLSLPGGLDIPLIGEPYWPPPRPRVVMFHRLVLMPGSSPHQGLYYCLRCRIRAAMHFLGHVFPKKGLKAYECLEHKAHGAVMPTSGRSFEPTSLSWDRQLKTGFLIPCRSAMDGQRAEPWRAAK